jgi:hypothetical protein
MLVDEVLKSVTGDHGYPGDSTPSLTRELLKGPNKEKRPKLIS